jgi:hypothetical protein
LPSISTLQHFRCLSPFLSLPYESVQHALPCTLEVPSVGFGYPFDGVSLTATSEASFSSQRSWASPFEAFLQPHDRISCFQPFFRSGTFLTNFPACYRCSNGFIPRRQPYPFRTRRFSPGRGHCSLGSFGLLGSPSNQRCLQVSLLKGSPHILCGKSSWLPTSTPGISGSLSLVVWLSPPERGAGLSDLSHRLS